MRFDRNAKRQVLRNGRKLPIPKSVEPEIVIDLLTPEVETAREAYNNRCEISVVYINSGLQSLLCNMGVRGQQLEVYKMNRFQKRRSPS